MKHEKTIELPLIEIGPSLTVGFADGQRIAYTDYVLPEGVSKALGMGCTGSHYAQPSHWAKPVAVCLTEGFEKPVVIAVRPATN